MTEEQIIGQTSLFDQDTWSGKMFQEPSAPTEDAVIPGPENGKWSYSGCIMGDGWSIAWRIHDAQFWGVPQRRKRIALVADFGGGSAPEILFVRKGLSRDTEPSFQERQGTAENPERCIGESDK